MDSRTWEWEGIPEFVSPSTYSFPAPTAAAMSALNVPMLLEMLLWLIKEVNVPPG
jgi:hypothetical protein